MKNKWRNIFQSNMSCDVKFIIAISKNPEPPTPKTDPPPPFPWSSSLNKTHLQNCWNAWYKLCESYPGSLLFNIVYTIQTKLFLHGIDVKQTFHTYFKHIFCYIFFSGLILQKNSEFTWIFVLIYVLLVDTRR